VKTATCSINKWIISSSGRKNISSNERNKKEGFINNDIKQKRRDSSKIYKRSE
jgi:Neuraminidase (sialidase)